MTHRFTHSLTCWFPDLLIHWIFIASLLHWFTDSLIHWFIGSSVHRFIDALIHWFIESLARWFIQSVVCWFLSCHFVGISSTICWVVDAFHNFNISLLLHLTNFPLGQWFLIVVLFVRNFLPRHDRALPCNNQRCLGTWESAIQTPSIRIDLNTRSGD